MIPAIFVELLGGPANPSTSDWATLIVASLIAVMGAVGAALFWFGRRPGLLTRPPSFPVTDRVWRHVALSLPVSALGSLLLVIAAWCAFLSNGWLVLVFGAPALLVALVGLPCVFTFNQPAVLVPPAYRE